MFSLTLLFSMCDVFYQYAVCMQTYLVPLRHPNKQALGTGFEMFSNSNNRGKMVWNKTAGSDFLFLDINTRAISFVKPTFKLSYTHLFDHGNPNSA